MAKLSWPSSGVRLNHRPLCASMLMGALFMGLGLTSCEGDSGPDPCLGVNCNLVGTCINVGGEAQCDCSLGYESVGATCQAICGDGMIGIGELCDDGNYNVADGCTICRPDAGYTCQGEPSICATACGDGSIGGGEECDDGNANQGDGCDPQCQVEPGWECVGAPSVCELPVVIHVDYSSSASNPGGLSWAQAYPTVQAGVDAANSYLLSSPGADVELWVARGTYYPYDYPGHTLTLHADIRLYGGFQGTEQARSERSPYLSAQTILNGEGTVESIMSATGADGLIIDGFILQNGEGSQGGALRLDSSNATVRNCTFTDSHASNGGAIYILTSTVAVYNSTFLRNDSGRGGAVYLQDGGFSATNTVFAENSSGWGGAFATANTGSLSGTFTNCTFYANDATYGRAIDADFANINNSIVWGHGTNDPISASVTGGNNVSEDVSGSGTGDPNTNADPMFTNATAGDFTLRAGSPCIDAASDTQAPSSDILGRLRYDDPSSPNSAGGIADIGAYEYQP